jgi:shikimate 5-dehydrogenase
VKKIKKDLDKKRREFIKKSTLVGAGIAATAVVPGVATAGVSVDRPEDKQQKGYQLTPHVIEYYKSLAN